MDKIRKALIILVIIGAPTFLALGMYQKFYPKLDLANNQIGFINSHLINFFSPIFNSLQKLSQKISNIPKALQEVEFYEKTAEYYKQQYENAQIKIQELEKQIKPLQKIANYNGKNPYKNVTVKVLGFPAREFLRFMIIENPTDCAIEKDMVVIYKNCLLGRIAHVYGKTAKVMLINDPLSKVPIKFSHTNTQGILHGNGTNLLIRDLVSINDETPPSHDKKYTYESQPSSNFTVGEYVFTSGIGGIYPPDLKVAKIINSENQNNVIAQPLFNYQDLDFVTVITEKW